MAKSGKPPILEVVEQPVADDVAPETATAAGLVDSSSVADDGALTFTPTTLSPRRANRGGWKPSFSLRSGLVSIPVPVLRMTPTLVMAPARNRWCSTPWRHWV